MQVSNLFHHLPSTAPAEMLQTLLETPGCRLERIVSTGQATPPGEWYDQPGDEWVVLLSGAARLRWADQPEPLELVPGDYLLIPAHSRHRVEWTSPDVVTVWLALHLRPSASFE